MKRPNKKEIHEQVNVQYFHRNKEVNKRRNKEKTRGWDTWKKWKNKEVKRRFFQTTNFDFKKHEYKKRETKSNDKSRYKKGSPKHQPKEVKENEIKEKATKTKKRRCNQET